MHLDFDCCSWQHCLDDPCVQRRQAGPAGEPLAACSSRHILHKNRSFPFLTRSARHLLSTLLAHLVVDKTRFHSSSPAALNPDHCHYHKELLNVKPTKNTTRKAGQCGLQLTCVVGRTAAPRLRLDRLPCSGVVQPATEPSAHRPKWSVVALFASLRWAHLPLSSRCYTEKRTKRMLAR